MNSFLQVLSNDVDLSRTLTEKGTDTFMENDESIISQPKASQVKEHPVTTKESEVEPNIQKPPSPNAIISFKECLFCRQQCEI